MNADWEHAAQHRDPRTCGQLTAQGITKIMLVGDSRIRSSWCNTEGQRHHERTCIDMDVVVVQAAFPHIFDQQVFRKGLILDIGVCIMEEK